MHIILLSSVSLFAGVVIIALNIERRGMKYYEKAALAAASSILWYLIVI